MSVDVVVSVVLQGGVLWSLFVLYTSELFLIVGNHIVDHADDNTIYIVIHRPILRSQVILCAR